MTPTERVLLICRLRFAVDQMAGRYGLACMAQAAARTSAEYAKADQVANRQYRALLRLTTALADLVGGTR